LKEIDVLTRANKRARRRVESPRGKSLPPFYHPRRRTGADSKGGQVGSHDAACSNNAPPSDSNARCYNYIRGKPDIRLYSYPAWYVALLPNRNANFVESMVCRTYHDVWANEHVIADFYISPIRSCNDDVVIKTAPFPDGQPVACVSVQVAIPHEARALTDCQAPESGDDAPGRNVEAA
jgi:hypothetical protein